MYRMKFFFFLLLTVCCNSLFSQTYYNIELLNKGQSITPVIAVGKGDITWHMTLNHSCRIDGNETNFSIHNFNTSLQLVIDMGYLTYLCGGYGVGDSLHIEAGITNPGHPLYGYRGKKSYAVSQLGSQVYLGCNGINLLPRAMIRIDDTTVCGRNGDILRAYVLHAPSGYRIDWQDSRLRPLGGDSASIEGFPGDTVLSLSAILRDSAGRGLDTAYYKLKLKPLPDVEVTPSYRFCEKGEEYVFSGHFADGNDYHWVHRSYAPSVNARKTVTFPEVMEDRDVRYELFVTDRVTGCRNSDTAWVYRRPDVPLIDIDTNTMRTDIALKLTDTLEMDSIRIYSIPWDAYNVRGEGYRERALLKSTGEMQTWVETDLKDTLRFYYAKAYRNIPGVGIIESGSSDTVGYFRQFLLGVNASAGSRNNLVSILFDMSQKGVITNRELCSKLLDSRLLEDMLSINAFDRVSQTWNMDNYLNFWEIWTGEECILNPGEVYMIHPTEQIVRTEFLTYGKLSPKVSYHFITGPKGNNNIACLPLHHADLRTTGEIVDRLGHEVTVSYWDFPSQKWISTFYNPGDPAIGIAPSMMGSVPVYPGMPLMINVQQPLDWK